MIPKRMGLLPLLRIVLGTSILTGTVFAAVEGQRWYVLVQGFALALGLLIGFGRLFRAGVRRTATEVVCRFVPWFEGNFYLMCVFLPLIGIATVAMANEGAAIRNLGPGLTRFLGIAFLAVTPLTVWGVARQWNRCRLSIGSSALTVGVVKPGPKPIRIPREDVDTVRTEIVTPGTQGIIKIPQIALAYRSPDSGASTTTIQIGPNIANSRETGLQLSVKPENLARALVAWKDGSASDPELLDRVEALLRGR